MSEPVVEFRAEEFATYRAVSACIRFFVDDPRRIAKAIRVHGLGHEGLCVAHRTPWPCLTRQLAEEALARLTRH